MSEDFDLVLQETPSPKLLGESESRLDVWMGRRIAFDIAFNDKLNRFVVDPSISAYGNSGIVDFSNEATFKKRFNKFVSNCNPLFLNTKEKLTSYNLGNLGSFEMGSKGPECLDNVEKEFDELKEKMGIKGL